MINSYHDARSVNIFCTLLEQQDADYLAVDSYNGK
jgi:hypothetical protein